MIKQTNTPSTGGKVYVLTLENAIQRFEARKIRKSEFRQMKLKNRRDSCFACCSSAQRINSPSRALRLLFSFPSTSSKVLQSRARGRNPWIFPCTACMNSPRPRADQFDDRFYIIRLSGENIYVHTHLRARAHCHAKCARRRKLESGAKL